MIQLGCHFTYEVYLEEDINNIRMSNDEKLSTKKKLENEN